MGFFFERPTMSDIQTIALDRALAMLKGANCKYAVITADGRKFIDGLEVMEPAKPGTRRSSKYAHGALSAHYRAVIDLNAEVGTTQYLPLNGFDMPTLRGSMSAWLTTQWGKDSYITNFHNDLIEVMRIA